MTVTTYKWTIKRFHQAIDAGVFDDEPLELLRGELIVMPPEREIHAYRNTETADYLRTLLGDKAKIRDTKPITLPNNSEPSPDITIIKPLGEIYLQHHPYPEDIFWIIEFANTTLNKDLGIKKEIYAEVGIMEYWVVDLKKPELIVFRDLQNQQYQNKLSLTTGSISPLAFPDLSVQVQHIIGSRKLSSSLDGVSF